MSDAQIFLVLFLVLFTVHAVLERILAVLNIRYILARRSQIPEMLSTVVSPETYGKSIEYAQVKSNFGHVSACAGTVMTLIYLFSGFLPWLNDRIGRWELGSLTHGVVLLLAFGFVNAVLDLPLELYQTFRIEAHFGFNKMDMRTFWLDKLKGGILTLAIGVPLIFVLLLFVTRSGPLWWLWAGLFMILFQCLMMVLFPLVIAPLFNKFTPLEDGALKSALESLAEKCRFATRGIFVMDGSKRSSHSNAYFTGIGKSRRIVLFDTLVHQLSIPELAAVLAHEIGHFKKKHIPKMLMLSTVMMLAGFFVLGLLLNWPPMYEAFGIDISGMDPARYAALGFLLFSMISGAFTFWIGPLFSKLSRKHEYEADAYAAEQTGDPAAMEGALIKLFEKNLSTISPHPAYSAFYYSHPTLLERMIALRSRAT